MKKIVFTGGGTLGHVMPNVYLMQDLTDYEKFYIGTNGIEKEKIFNNVAEYYEIPATKLVRGKFFVNLKIPFVMISSIFKAKKVLKQIKPDVIFSKGGYVALPVCIAGRMLKIPIVAHESDYSFGLANKIILKLCSNMCVNFKNLEEKDKKIIHTGPIFSNEYQNIKIDTSRFNLDKNKKTMLIVGGSLGSEKINNAIYPILKDLLHNYNIIHITGKGNLKIKSFDNYNAFEMTNDMVNLYNIADFVVGRSGAGVTAECYFKKLPMMLIPLQNAASRGDQVLNAKYYQKQGVAHIVYETDITPTKLLEEINIFAKNLDSYKKCFAKHQQTNGKNKIIELIKKY